MTNTHDPRLGEMGIPLACGGPLCGIDHHHPLCKLATAPAAPVAAQAHPEIEITDGMALVFHNAITDGSIGQQEVDEIKTGLRAVFANIDDSRPLADTGLTQQTLDDVKAGIPARDAEIAALRKEIEALQAQQDADKVDAKRWRAYRVAIAAEDGVFLGRAESYLSSLGLRAEVLPTEGQIDAAIDAARKEQA